MTENEQSLLSSYENGPRIWDAASILREVYALESKGLIEPVGGRASSFAYQLTEAGRKILRGENG